MSCVNLLEVTTMVNPENSDGMNQAGPTMLINLDHIVSIQDPSNLSHIDLLDGTRINIRWVEYHCAEYQPDEQSIIAMTDGRIVLVVGSVWSIRTTIQDLLVNT